MRLVLLILLSIILSVTSALAAACPAPQVISGWSQSFPGSSVLQTFVYGLDSGLLFTVMYSNQYNTFINVPISVPQQFTYTKIPDTFYLQNVKPIYHQAVETEKCQILTAENGTVLVVH